MPYEDIRVAQDLGVLTLTLHRPEKLNVFTLRMGEEIMHALARARDDDSVRALVLTGAGRAFCAGVDRDILRHTPDTHDARDAIARGEFARRYPEDLAVFPKPVVAAINGAAIGMGLAMALPCDIRLAAEDARIGLTWTRVGALPGLGSSLLLQRILGPARARELVLGGRTLDGREAAEAGLVSRALPGAQLLGAAQALAAELAALDPLVMRHVKQVLLRSEGASLEEARRIEAEVGESLLKGKAARLNAELGHEHTGGNTQ
jgi:enoyl-CoA hydratase/carnithine racemase